MQLVSYVVKKYSLVMQFFTESKESPELSVISGVQVGRGGHINDKGRKIAQINTVSQCASVCPAKHESQECSHYIKSGDRTSILLDKLDKPTLNESLAQGGFGPLIIGSMRKNHTTELPLTILYNVKILQPFCQWT